MPDLLVIADASPIIALVEIGELELLQQLYEKVSITDIVRGEILADLPAWVEVSTQYDQKQFQILQLELDPGEASASHWRLKIPAAGSSSTRIKGGQWQKGLA
ncbi:MAG: hypothetical protein H7246_02910 [Phycisphaerae bacterium]|nr:hypothetical protein [Saprospiraceae bacterium]